MSIHKAGPQLQEIKDVQPVPPDLFREMEIEPIIYHDDVLNRLNEIMQEANEAEKPGLISATNNLFEVLSNDDDPTTFALKRLESDAAHLEEVKNMVYPEKKLMIINHGLESVLKRLNIKDTQDTMSNRDPKEVRRDRVDVQVYGPNAAQRCIPIYTDTDSYVERFPTLDMELHKALEISRDNIPRYPGYHAKDRETRIFNTKNHAKKIQSHSEKN